MYSKILVPLDGSDLAEQVLPYVRLLAKGFQAEVELIRVIELMSPYLSEAEHGLYLDRVTAEMRATVREYLEKLCASLREDGLTVSSTVQEGDPATHIVDKAEEEPATLVAMTTHGRSGISRWMLGSVSDKVLRATTNPLLIVRAQERETFAGEVSLQTVVVPLDGSPVAEEVLPHALAVARALDLGVMLCRVVPTPQLFYDNGEVVYIQSEVDLMRLGESILNHLDVQAVSYLERVERELGQEKVSSVETRLLHGYPADAIVDLVGMTPGVLVAMTTHGRSGVSRWVLGNVTDRVVRRSGGPVLVVRAMDESQEG